jgi:hypothetical protein
LNGEEMIEFVNSGFPYFIYPVAYISIQVFYALVMTGPLNKKVYIIVVFMLTLLIVVL